MGCAERGFFHPWNDIDSYNYLKINKKFEEIFIESEGKILRGWLNYNIYEDKSPLIIFFIGNAQNSSNFCKYFENKFKYFEGYNTLIIDYPQFGYSTGRLDEKIKYEHSVRLSEKFSKINKMVTLEDVGHQYFFEIPLVLEEMKEYLKERL